MDWFEYAILSAKISEADEWDKWQKEIPFINWPSEWGVKAIPAFAGAIIRYRVKTPKCEDVSVYLDCYDRLGCMRQPYWEVYPIDGDTFRCFLHETKELIDAIGRAG